MPTSTTVDEDNQIVVPVNNASNTYVSISTQGMTSQAAGREFLIFNSMISNMGVGIADPNADKVTRYAEMRADAGSRNTWVDNTVIRISEGAIAAGLNFVCGFEIDVQNQDADLGAADGQAGLSPPSCYALALEGGGGESGHSITAAMLVGAVDNSQPFNKGIVFSNNAIVQECIGDYTQATNSYRDFGTHQVGISLQGTYSLAAIQISSHTSITNNGSNQLEIANSNGVRYYNGTDKTILFRGPVTLSDGSSIFSANDANSALRPMEIAASELYLSSATTFRVAPAANLHAIGDLNVTALSDTQIRINYKGQDGIVRGVTLTIS